MKYSEDLPQQQLKAGEVLFTEGEAGDKAYIIESGEIEIYVEEANGDIQIFNTLDSGQMFGELALIDNSPRSASARAKNDVILRTISSYELQDILDSAEPILQVLLKAVMKYFRSETERLKIVQYSENLEAQISIRKQSMEEAFAEIHNGPLQTLAVLLKEIQEPDNPHQSLFSKIKALDSEIRAVGEHLTQTTDIEEIKLATFEQEYTGHLMRLGSGSIVELNKPLHELFYSIFRSTLERNFPHFAKTRIKIVDFTPYPDESIDFATKRNICFCFEEALCNIGKHAQGATKIIAVSEVVDDLYVLRVEDNGCGLVSHKKNKGSKLCENLAQMLDGKFILQSLEPKGALFTISWKY